MFETLEMANEKMMQNITEKLIEMPPLDTSNDDVIPFFNEFARRM
jgi:hypothetical protein